MNGIFGIINLKDEPVLIEDLERMKQTLIHRGPDGSGIWKEGPAGMGHLKMNITPDSVYEKLPHVSPHNNRVITADVRLDNREELFQQLTIPHAEREKMPDGILILKAYEKWGDACPTYLVGEFAFAIWDKQERTLFCARDHMGFKPFYYYCSAAHFVFATEIKTIRCLPFVPVKINEAAIARALLPPNLAHDNSFTFFEGIMSLNLGHWLRVKFFRHADRIKVTCYWDPCPKGRLRLSSDNEYAETLQELMKDAVHCRLRALPGLSVGVTLSGGLDSSAVACIAARKLQTQGKRLLAVSSVLPLNHKGIESDERQYIRMVLEQEPNIDIQYVTAPNAGPFDDLEIFFNQTERQGNCFNYMDHALRCAAQNQGVSLLLSGLGGDHMASFSGRDSLFRLTEAFKWGKALGLAHQLSQIENRPLSRILKQKVILPFLPLWCWNIIQNKKKLPGIDMENTPVNPDFAKTYGFQPMMYKRNARHLARDYNSRILSKIRIGKFIVEPENIHNAYLGLTGLFPFFDKRITEFFLAVPPEQFLVDGWPRSLFRRAMEGILPPAIQWRKGKNAYTPDFHRRVKTSEKEIMAFLDTIKKDNFVHRYVDVERIKTQLKHVRPVRSGPEHWEGQTQQIVVKGIVLIKFLYWLERQK